MTLKKDIIFSDLRQKVSDTAIDFPDQVRSPDVNTDVRPSAVASYHITGSQWASLSLLREELAKWEEELLKSPNVGKVQWKGLPEEVIEIRLNAVELKKHSLFPLQVKQAVQSEFAPQSIGKQERDGTSYLLKMKNYTRLLEFDHVHGREGSIQ